MTTQITSWKNDIYPTIACPEPSLIEAVRSAVRDFCKETYLWILTLDRISVVANTQDYTLSIPTAWSGSAEIIVVDNVKYKQDGQDDDQFVTLDPVSENQKNLHDTGNWKERTSATPNGWWADVASKQLHFYYIPTAASTEGVLVEVVAKPTLSATVLPDFFYNDYRDTITKGALAHLFDQGHAPWYDEKKADKYMARFKIKCSEARWVPISGASKRRARLNLNLNRGVWP